MIHWLEMTNIAAKNSQYRMKRGERNVSGNQSNQEILRLRESRVEVLKGIDLYVEQGEFCVLLGPSGSGKSTLLNIIGGIDQADSGDICIRGERMADMKEKKLTLSSQKASGLHFPDV